METVQDRSRVQHSCTDNTSRFSLPRCYQERNEANQKSTWLVEIQHQRINDLAMSFFGEEKKGESHRNHCDPWPSCIAVLFEVLKRLVKHVFRPRSRVLKRDSVGLGDFCAPGAGSAAWEAGNPPGKLNGMELGEDDCAARNMTYDPVGRRKQRNLVESGTA